MTFRLIRPLLVILLAMVLIGAPALQAAVAVPCATSQATVTDHRLPFGHSPAPTPTPCQKMMPACADMLGCGLSAGLPAHVTAAAHKLIWISVTYRAITAAQEGLSVKPDLGPPITI